MQTTEESSEDYVRRQVTDNETFIQLIYNSEDRLIDCEFYNDRNAIGNVRHKFREDFECSKRLGDSKSKEKCFDVNCTHLNHISADYVDVLDYNELEKNCRLVRRHVRPSLNKRNRRDLFLYPGTNWCGSGSSVRKFNQLGYNAASDRCCRDHDMCPYAIRAFTNKYYLFNYRFHTVSHCDCDERFRACLKLANSPTANMIGRLYFNIVQTKCFVFHTENICSKWSWWGKCLLWQNQNRALLKASPYY
ncbi:phospholipase A2-like [Centruroides sculpturatus]|uniref:phospholipase A2-like n=1 Tax=Centruroides sculpturatus TaxID=218467 RepID=UPI000C6CE8E3|nr:phospholipase A2-like [Centruroides sculpturatus]